MIFFFFLYCSAVINNLSDWTLIFFLWSFYKLRIVFILAFFPPFVSYYYLLTLALSLFKYLSRTHHMPSTINIWKCLKKVPALLELTYVQMSKPFALVSVSLLESYSHAEVIIIFYNNLEDGWETKYIRKRWFILRKIRIFTVNLESSIWLTETSEFDSLLKHTLRYAVCSLTATNNYSYKMLTL